MKSIIHAILFVTIVLGLHAPVLVAQDDAVEAKTIIYYPDEALNHYIRALKSENNGVVESAIFYAVKFTLFKPQSDVSRLEKELNRLVREGETEAIRYKAHIALQYVKNPELLSRIEKKNYKDNSDEFFKILTAELQNHYLVN